MKTRLAVAVSALALNCIATADVLASDAAKLVPAVKANSIVAPTTTKLHVTKAAPSIEKVLAPIAEPAMKWSWIPAKGNATQTEVVMLPVPAPGAAALLGLSGLIFARRRQA